VLDLLQAYKVPAGTDIPHLELVFIDEADPISSQMKAKGVGKRGTSGVGRGGGERGLQRHRCSGAQLPYHAGQADLACDVRGKGDDLRPSILACAVRSGAFGAASVDEGRLQTGPRQSPLGLPMAAF